eukprot:238540_1
MKMIKSDMNTNAVQQASLSNSSSTPISSPLIETNAQSCSEKMVYIVKPKPEIPPLDNNKFMGKDSRIQNIDLLLSETDPDVDVDVSKLNFEEIYVQHHCMDHEPIQLTPQQYEEIII